MALFPPYGVYAAEVVPADSGAHALPDLGTPPASGSTHIRPGPNGVAIESQFDRQTLTISPTYSNQTGASLGLAWASMLGDSGAFGVLLQTGVAQAEVLLNAGFRFDERQRLVLSAGQLEQQLDYSFASGVEKVGMAQTSGAFNYQLHLGRESLRFIELNGYVAQTASRALAAQTFSVDTATVYELWNVPRRIAGGTVTGLQTSLGFAPLVGSVVKVNLGYEQLRYDLFTGTETFNRLTGGLQWLQALGDGYQLSAAADAFAAHNRFAVGLQRSVQGSQGQHHIGLGLVGLRGRDGLRDDDQFTLRYTYTFGAKGAQPGTLAQAGTSTAAAPQQPPLRRVDSGLLQQVVMRPSVIPSSIVAKVDTTVVSSRLITVDKTALPTGASVNTATGDIAAPLGQPVSGITGVTKNLAPFANTGQFVVAGNTLVIAPSRITQPAAGAVDSYVVTLNNVGGDVTLVTVRVSHGSVKIDSIAIAIGDTTPPVSTVAPAVGGTTHTGTTLSATLNENGTGYYLVQTAGQPAPSVAAVLAGSSFAMAANVAASQAISGLAASTSYTLYFVAKDRANNPQASVQSVAFSTTAVPDTTPPVSTVAPAVGGTTHTGTTLSATLNENGTGYYLVQTAGQPAPSVAAVLAGSSFAMAANVAASQAISGLAASTSYTLYFVAKDRANNPQASVQSVAFSTTAVPDFTPPATPTLTAAPSAFINTNSVAVEVNGEVGAAVWVNGASTGATVAGSGKVTVNLDTSGADGVKNFSITLKDAALNTSGALAVSVEKGTAPPTSVAWNNAGGFIPEGQGGLYSGMVLIGNKSFIGATGMAIVALAGGTIANLSIDGSGRLVFDLTTPFAFSDTLHITGTDKYGNAILIDLVVPLPF